MSVVDLHVHSNCSDGSDSPLEIVDKVHRCGINVFALTDHDTLEGVKEIINIIPVEIKFIPSVELTCKFDNIKCHLLGYNCDVQNPILNDLIQKGKILRSEKLETRINYLKKVWGIELTESELSWLKTRKSVVKTHLANIIVNRGLAKDNLSAMRKYLDDCKTGNTRFDGEEAINAIISAGGIPVWAHPIGGEGEAHITETEFLPKLEQMMSFGIQGLECYYSRYNQNEISFLTKFASQNDLYISGGSDYHGKNKDIKLGKLNDRNLPINNELLTVLKAF